MNSRPNAGTARPFDAVLLDFYGTVAAGDREAVESTCRTIVEACRLPLSAPDFAIAWGERYFEVVAQSNREAFKTLYECELCSLQDMLARFGLDPDPVPFVAELEAYWRNPPLYPDAVEFLDNVGLPVCCVSNADVEPLQTAIRRHGLRFDAVVASESVRSYKPDSEIFREALRVMGMKPERVMHVGDSLHSDVEGASRVGIAATWVCREKRIHDIGNHRPWRTVAGLSEVHTLLA